MCVIVLKPEGVSLPNESTIRKCWAANPDGAGFMIRRAHGVEWVKGFMKLGHLQDALNKLGDVTKLDVAIHFRIGTHGPNDAKRTHPFPVGGSYEDMEALWGNAGAVAMHNGIFGDIDKASPKSSDTMVWLRRNLDESMCKSLLKSKPLSSLCQEALGTNKLLVFTAAGWWRSAGWSEDAGCFFSNDRWQPYTSRAAGRWVPQRPQTWKSYFHDGHGNIAQNSGPGMAKVMKGSLVCTTCQSLMKPDFKGRMCPICSAEVFVTRWGPEAPKSGKDKNKNKSAKWFCATCGEPIDPLEDTHCPMCLDLVEESE